MEKVYIDPETADRIVVAALRESMLCLRLSIKKLKGEKKLKSFQKEDLADAISSLDAMEKVFDYYGGNLE